MTPDRSSHESRSALTKPFRPRAGLVGSAETLSATIEPVATRVVIIEIERNDIRAAPWITINTVGPTPGLVVLLEPLAFKKTVPWRFSGLPFFGFNGVVRSRSMRMATTSELFVLTLPMVVGMVVGFFTLAGA